MKPKNLKFCPNVNIKIIVFLFLIAQNLFQISVLQACEAIDGSLNSKEVSLLKVIGKKEKAAGITSNLLLIGPIATMIAGNPAENALEVATKDWKLWSESGNHLNTVLSKSIVNEIDLFRVTHEDGHTPAGQLLFDCIRSHYDKNL